MGKMKIIGATVAVFIVLPIWFYLLFKVLAAVNASELMWFLFWIYVPAAVLSVFITHVLAKDE